MVVDFAIDESGNSDEEEALGGGRSDFLGRARGMLAPVYLAA